MNLQDLRKLFGIVLQDPFLFTGTLESNVKLGSENITRVGAESALREVGLGPFLDSQPLGLDTAGDRAPEATLSVGQRQLVSFARALAHDPKLLIFDEATSSVDTKPELMIRDALNRLARRGRTADGNRAPPEHDSARASPILVFHKGRLREQGSHQESFWRGSGIYYRLYQLQYCQRAGEFEISAGRPGSVQVLRNLCPPMTDAASPAHPRKSGTHDLHVQPILATGTFAAAA